MRGHRRAGQRLALDVIQTLENDQREQWRLTSTDGCDALLILVYADWINHGGSQLHHDPALAQRLISHGLAQDPSISGAVSTLASPYISDGALMLRSAPISRPCSNPTPRGLRSRRI